MNNFELYHGNSLEILKKIEDNSVDSIVTDPPYGLSFMGKKWDYDVPSQEIWAECLRVLKPGGHLLAFAGTRTQHKMAVRIEDAGFEIRDMLAWVYGSGFPKGINIAKAITSEEKTGGSSPRNLRKARQGNEYEPTGQENYKAGRAFSSDIKNDFIETDLTVNANAWNGWNTSLKPAMEPITLARKPLSEKTVAKNVLKYGTGGLNIDGCRVDNPDYNPNAVQRQQSNRQTWEGGEASGFSADHVQPTYNAGGRWPANFIHDGSTECIDLLQDSARFFYCPKASKKDRGQGNNHPTVKPTELMRYLSRMVTPPGGTLLDPFMGSGSTGKAAILEGFNFIGIDLEESYFDIARSRIEEVSKIKSNT